MAKKNAKSPPASFEASLDELRAIVASLEEGNLSLDDSLKKYEAGVKHLNTCYAALRDAQRKIEILVELDENGKLKTVPFDDQASEFGGSGSDEEEPDVVDGNDTLF
jgi:exodeoxyribonuclease VII small subunit